MPSKRGCNSVLAIITVVCIVASPAYAYNEDYFNRIASAIYHAEGGARTRYPFGILNKSCEGYAQCRYMCREIVRVHWLRWQRAGNPGDFLSYLQSRYAPTVNATNDPHGLNSNWKRNVSYYMEVEMQ